MDYELIYEYLPTILATIKERVEQHEKDIYHELRELNGLPRTKITANNTQWKDELKRMLSIEGYQLTMDDLGEKADDFLDNITNALYEAGYTTDIVYDKGVEQIVNTLKEGHFPNKKTLLTKREKEGLQKELLTVVKRYAWAKELDDDAIVMNTYEFNRGAYSEGKLDISIRFPKVHNRRQVRSEVKNYLDIFKIGTLEDKYITPILDTMRFMIDSTKTLIFFLSGRVIEKYCNQFILDKYQDFFPLLEDGEQILLFSEFIESVLSGEHLLQLRNYGEDILTPIKRPNLSKHDLRELGYGRSYMILIPQLYRNTYSLWYGKGGK